MVERYSFDLGLEGEGVRPCKFGAWVGWNDYAALLAENERLKVELKVTEGNLAFAMRSIREIESKGYTAADIATAAADGFRDGVRSVDLEQFRNAVMFHLSDAQQSSEVEDGERLLALIDAHKGE